MNKLLLECNLIIILNLVISIFLENNIKVLKEYVFFIILLLVGNIIFLGRVFYYLLPTLTTYYGYMVYISENYRSLKCLKCLVNLKMI